MKHALLLLGILTVSGTASCTQEPEQPNVFLDSRFLDPDPLRARFEAGEAQVDVIVNLRKTPEIASFFAWRNRPLADQHRARVKRGRRDVLSPARRHFCKRCGSALWAWDKDWPDWVYPAASAIDTKLPVPPRRTHLMLGSKAAWVEPHIKRGDKQFSRYPDEGIADWHDRMGVWRK